MRILVLVLACVLLPAGLVYTIGWWTLPACMFGVLVLCLVSVGEAKGPAARRGGALTHYDTELDSEP